MKKKITKWEESFSAHDFGTTALEIISRLNQLIDEYGDTVYLDYDYEGRFDIMTVREETEEEYQERLASEERNKIAQQQYKLRQYEQLKKELGLE